MALPLAVALVLAVYLFSSTSVQTLVGRMQNRHMDDLLGRSTVLLAELQAHRREPRRDTSFLLPAFSAAVSALGATQRIDVGAQLAYRLSQAARPAPLDYSGALTDAQRDSLEKKHLGVYLEGQHQQRQLAAPVQEEDGGAALRALASLRSLSESRPGVQAAAQGHGGLIERLRDAYVEAAVRQPPSRSASRERPPLVAAAPAQQVAAAGWEVDGSAASAAASVTLGSGEIATCIPESCLLPLLLAVTPGAASAGTRASIESRLAAWQGVQATQQGRGFTFGDVVEAYLSTCLEAVQEEAHLALAASIMDRAGDSEAAAAAAAAAALGAGGRERASSVASSTTSSTRGPGMDLDDIAAPAGGGAAAAPPARAPPTPPLLLPLAMSSCNAPGLGRRGLAEQLFGGTPVVAGRVRGGGALPVKNDATQARGHAQAQARTQAQDYNSSRKRAKAGTGMGAHPSNPPALSALQAGRPPRAPLPSAMALSAAKGGASSSASAGCGSSSSSSTHWAARSVEDASSRSTTSSTSSSSAATAAPLAPTAAPAAAPAAALAAAPAAAASTAGAPEGTAGEVAPALAAPLPTPPPSALALIDALPLLESLAGLHPTTASLLHPQQTLRLWHCFVDAAAAACTGPATTPPRGALQLAQAAVAGAPPPAHRQHPVLASAACSRLPPLTPDSLSTLLASPRIDLPALLGICARLGYPCAHATATAAAAATATPTQGRAFGGLLVSSAASPPAPAIFRHAEDMMAARGTRTTSTTTSSGGGSPKPPPTLGFADLCDFVAGVCVWGGEAWLDTLGSIAKAEHIARAQVALGEGALAAEAAQEALRRALDPQAAPTTAASASATGVHPLDYAATLPTSAPSATSGGAAKAWGAHMLLPGGATPAAGKWPLASSSSSRSSSTALFFAVPIIHPLTQRVVKVFPFPPPPYGSPPPHTPPPGFRDGRACPVAIHMVDGWGGPAGTDPWALPMGEGALCAAAEGGGGICAASTGTQLPPLNYEAYAIAVLKATPCTQLLELPHSKQAEAQAASSAPPVTATTATTATVVKAAIEHPYPLGTRVFARHKGGKKAYKGTIAGVRLVRAPTAAAAAAAVPAAVGASPTGSLSGAGAKAGEGAARGLCLIQYSVSYDDGDEEDDIPSKFVRLLEVGDGGAATEPHPLDPPSAAPQKAASALEAALAQQPPPAEHMPPSPSAASTVQCAPLSTAAATALALAPLDTTESAAAGTPPSTSAAAAAAEVESNSKESDASESSGALAGSGSLGSAPAPEPQKLKEGEGGKQQEQEGLESPQPPLLLVTIEGVPARTSASVEGIAAIERLVAGVVESVVAHVVSGASGGAPVGAEPKSLEEPVVPLVAPTAPPLHVEATPPPLPAPDKSPEPPAPPPPAPVAPVEASTAQALPPAPPAAAAPPAPEQVAAAEPPPLASAPTGSDQALSMADIAAAVKETAPTGSTAPPAHASAPSPPAASAPPPEEPAAPAPLPPPPPTALAEQKQPSSGSEAAPVPAAAAAAAAAVPTKRSPPSAPCSKPHALPAGQEPPKATRFFDMGDDPPAPVSGGAAAAAPSLATPLANKKEAVFSSFAAATSSSSLRLSVSFSSTLESPGSAATMPSHRDATPSTGVLKKKTAAASPFADPIAPARPQSARPQSSSGSRGKR